MQTIDLKKTEAIDLSYLFTQLLHYRDHQAQGAHPDCLGRWLHRQLSDRVCPPLPDLPFQSGAYTRTYLSKELPNTQAPASLEPRFEALAMRWDQQVKTSVHGHPQFSFYYVMSGIFEIEFFGQTATGDLYTKETQQLKPTESTWFQGEAHRYDNCIHRVNCLQAGQTFHVYSDDALKGTVFNQNGGQS